MKKFICIIALLVMSSAAWAVDTPTPTLTPTATFTPTPVLPEADKARVVIMPQSVFFDNGVVLASSVTTPVAGSANPYLAMASVGAVSRTAFVLASGTAAARFSTVLPNNFERNPQVWLYCSTTKTASAITVSLNVLHQNVNASLTTTQTAKVFVGTATDISASYPGLQNSATQMKRVKVPMPTMTDLKRGDLMSFLLSRTSGDALINVYAIEVTYDPLAGRNP